MPGGGAILIRAGLKPAQKRTTLPPCFRNFIVLKKSFCYAQGMADPTELTHAVQELKNYLLFLKDSGYTEIPLETGFKESNSGFIHDITEEVGGLKAEKILKILNRKEDGSSFLPGIAPVQREISYIPSPDIDAPILKKIRTGDYIGIYSHAAGLDVSHVGVFIREGGKSYLRHASSQPEFRKVIDQDFQGYIQNKPGIIIFRPLMYYPHPS